MFPFYVQANALLTLGLATGRLSFAQVVAKPDPSGLPGTDKLQQLVNGAYLWVLLLTLAALMVSAAVWAWGSQSNNVRAASDGRRGVGVALLAALLIGAAPMLVNWFYGLGR